MLCIISKGSTRLDSRSTRGPLPATHGPTTRRPASPSSSTARHSGRGGCGVGQRRVASMARCGSPFRRHALVLCLLVVVV